MLAYNAIPLIPCCAKPKNITLVFVLSPSKQEVFRSRNHDCLALGQNKMPQSGAACLADCCFSKLELEKMKSVYWLSTNYIS